MAISRLMVSAILPMLCVLGGCLKKSTAHGYFIYMVNMTHHDFEGVTVYFNGRVAADKGHLVRGGLASFGYVTLPVPDEAEVRWIDEGKNPSPKPQIADNDYSPEAVARLNQWIEQGAHHAPKVTLTGIVPENPVGKNIYFIIHENGTVVVKCIDRKDMNGPVDPTQGLRELRQEIGAGSGAPEP